MAGHHRHDSPGPDAGTSGFLARWSERKRAAVPAEAAAPPEDTRKPTVAAESGTHPPASGGAPKPLTDQDMPDLESLNEESDYSGFLSPGVSDALHRLALRKLFGAAKFQVRDGLDDYDTDYHRLQPLHRVLAGVTQDEFAPPLQRATGKLTVPADDATGHTIDEQDRSAADPAQQDAGSKPPADRTEETGK